MPAKTYGKQKNFFRIFSWITLVFVQPDAKIESVRKDEGKEEKCSLHHGLPSKFEKGYSNE